MTSRSSEGWRSMNEADRSGVPILVTVRGGEQGAPEVDTVRWAMPRGSHDKCWIAIGSAVEATVIYEDDDLVAWMPFPSPTPDRGSFAVDSMQPARESDFLEQSGSGI